jgi:hypothetical protein
MELVVECSEAALLVQPQNSPPVVDRLFDFSINTSGPIESFRCGMPPGQRCYGLRQRLTACGRCNLGKGLMMSPLHAGLM